jgi:hypothetical protein
MADNGATHDIGIIAPPFLPPQGNGALPPERSIGPYPLSSVTRADERGMTVFIATGLPPNEPGGGLGSLGPRIKYIMEGYNTQMRRWFAYNAADMTGAFYTGLGATPTNISIAQKKVER